MRQRRARASVARRRTSRAAPRNAIAWGTIAGARTRLRTSGAARPAATIVHASARIAVALPAPAAIAPARSTGASICSGIPDASLGRRGPYSKRYCCARVRARARSTSIQLARRRSKRDRCARARARAQHGDRESPRGR